MRDKRYFLWSISWRIGLFFPFLKKKIKGRTRGFVFFLEERTNEPVFSMLEKTNKNCLSCKEKDEKSRKETCLFFLKMKNKRKGQTGYSLAKRTNRLVLPVLSSGVVFPSEERPTDPVFPVLKKISKVVFPFQKI